MLRAIVAYPLPFTFPANSFPDVGAKREYLHAEMMREVPTCLWPSVGSLLVEKAVHVFQTFKGEVAFIARVGKPLCHPFRCVNCIPDDCRLRRVNIDLTSRLWLRS